VIAIAAELDLEQRAAGGHRRRLGHHAASAKTEACDRRGVAELAIRARGRRAACLALRKVESHDAIERVRRARGIGLVRAGACNSGRRRRAARLDAHAAFETLRTERA